jgi:hypothetical protein
VEILGAAATGASVDFMDGDDDVKKCINHPHCTKFRLEFDWDTARNDHGDGFGIGPLPPHNFCVRVHTIETRGPVTFGTFTIDAQSGEKNVFGLTNIQPKQFSRDGGMMLCAHTCQEQGELKCLPDDVECPDETCAKPGDNDGGGGGGGGDSGGGGNGGSGGDDDDTPFVKNTDDVENQQSQQKRNRKTGKEEEEEEVVDDGDSLIMVLIIGGGVLVLTIIGTALFVIRQRHARGATTNGQWKKVMDKESGRFFYHNTKTGKTSWVPPDGMDFESNPLQVELPFSYQANGQGSSGHRSRHHSFSNRMA